MGLSSVRSCSSKTSLHIYDVLDPKGRDFYVYDILVSAKMRKTPSRYLPNDSFITLNCDEVVAKLGRST